MCFYIHKDHIEAKTADKDITCYKVLLVNGNKFWHALRLAPLEAPYRSTLYRLWVTYKSEIIMRGDNTIENGLHSLTNFKQAVHKLEEIERTDMLHSIYKAIIPKNSTYYYDPIKNEYVSNQLRIIEKTSNSYVRAIRKDIADEYKARMEEAHRSQKLQEAPGI